MNRRDRQLRAIGLTRWVRREARPGADAGSGGADAGPLTVLREASDPVAVVLLLGGAPPAAGDRHMALLDRILQSLEAPPARFRVLHGDDAASAELQALGAQRIAGRPLLVFAAAAPRVADAILLPSLEAMLADPAAKRPAWARLKPLVGTLGP